MYFGSSTLALPLLLRGCWSRRAEVHEGYPCLLRHPCLLCHPRSRRGSAREEIRLYAPHITFHFISFHFIKICLLKGPVLELSSKEKEEQHHPHVFPFLIFETKIHWNVTPLVRQGSNFFLVSHLKLGQRKDDTAEGWLEPFFFITLYQQLHISYIDSWFSPNAHLQLSTKNLIKFEKSSVFSKPWRRELCSKILQK